MKVTALASIFVAALALQTAEADKLRARKQKAKLQERGIDGKTVVAIGGALLAGGAILYKTGAYGWLKSKLLGHGETPADAEPAVPDQPAPQEPVVPQEEDIPELETHPLGAYTQSLARAGSLRSHPLGPDAWEEEDDEGSTGDEEDANMLGHTLSLSHKEEEEPKPSRASKLDHVKICKNNSGCPYVCVAADVVLPELISRHYSDVSDRATGWSCHGTLLKEVERMADVAEKGTLAALLHDNPKLAQKQCAASTVEAKILMKHIKQGSKSCRPNRFGNTYDVPIGSAAFYKK